MTELEELGVVCAADVEPEEVLWLWRPYIPKGMVTIIEGDPGLGKSWMTMGIAAALSSGQKLPGAKFALPPMKVLVMNAEDSYAHTVVPRLIAMGANRENILLADRYFPLDVEGLKSFERILKSVSVGIVFMDPLVAYLGSKVDMHRANEVRAVMGAMGHIAEATGTAIIAVRHLRKGGGGGKAIYGGIGSIDFSAAARSVLLVERTKGGENVVQHIKCNIAKKGNPLSYELTEYETEDKLGRPVMSSKFEWLGEYTGPLETDDHPERPKAGSPKLEKARDLIRSMLADGPVPAEKMWAAARSNGISEQTFKRAKVGVAFAKPDGLQWFWVLGAKPPELDEQTVTEALIRQAELEAHG